MPQVDDIFKNISDAIEKQDSYTPPPEVVAKQYQQLLHDREARHEAAKQEMMLTIGAIVAIIFAAFLIYSSRSHIYRLFVYLAGRGVNAGKAAKLKASKIADDIHDSSLK